MARFLFSLLVAVLSLIAQPVFAGCAPTERELRITFSSSIVDILCIPSGMLEQAIGGLVEFQSAMAKRGIITQADEIEPVGPRFPFLEAEVCDLLETDVLPLIKEGWALAPDCSDLDETLAELKKLRKDAEGRQHACIGFETFFAAFDPVQRGYHPLDHVADTANFLRCGPNKG